MKKLIMVVMALALAMSALPEALAGETAQLDLKVTFAPPQDPDEARIAKLDQARVTITEEARVVYERVIGKDKYIEEIQRPDERPVERPVIPFIPDSCYHKPIPGSIEEAIELLSGLLDEMARLEAELRNIAERRPDLEELIRPVATGFEKGMYLIKEYIADLKNRLPVIAIELNETSWVLNDVKLGEVRSNLAMDKRWPTYVPLHKVSNTGNVPVGVDIRYVIPETYAEVRIKPGLEQGVDTFVTWVGDKPQTVLNPDGSGMALISEILPNVSIPVMLVYGAPKELSAGDAGMSVSYELRAYRSEEKPIMGRKLPK